MVEKVKTCGPRRRGRRALAILRVESIFSVRTVLKTVLEDHYAIVPYIVPTGARRALAISSMVVVGLYADAVRFRDAGGAANLEGEIARSYRVRHATPVAAVTVGAASIIGLRHRARPHFVGAGEPRYWAAGARQGQARLHR